MGLRLEEEGAARFGAKGTRFAIRAHGERRAPNGSERVSSGAWLIRHSSIGRYATRMAGGLSKGVRRAARELTTRMVDDARGRRVRLVPMTRRWGRIARAPEGMSDEAIARVVDLLQLTVKERVLQQAGMLVIAMIIGVIGVAAIRMKGFTTHWVWIAIFMVGVAFAGLSLGVALASLSSLRPSNRKFPVRIERIDPQRVASAIAATEHCASCGQDLRGLPTTDDGCTICPECGSAWKLEPTPSEVRA